MFSSREKFDIPYAGWISFVSIFDNITFNLLREVFKGLLIDIFNSVTKLSIGEMNLMKAKWITEIRFETIFFFKISEKIFCYF